MSNPRFSKSLLMPLVILANIYADIYSANAAVIANNTYTYFRSIEDGNINTIIDYRSEVDFIESTSITSGLGTNPLWLSNTLGSGIAIGNPVQFSTVTLSDTKGDGIAISGGAQARNFHKSGQHNLVADVDWPGGTFFHFGSIDPSFENSYVSGVLNVSTNYGRGNPTFLRYEYFFDGFNQGEDDFVKIISSSCQGAGTQHPQCAESGAEMVPFRDGFDTAFQINVRTPGFFHPGGNILSLNTGTQIECTVNNAGCNRIVDPLLLDYLSNDKGVDPNDGTIFYGLGSIPKLNRSTRGIVPEPLTILGSFTAIGFGILFKRNYKIKK